MWLRVYHALSLFEQYSGGDMPNNSQMTSTMCEIFHRRV